MLHLTTSTGAAVTTVDIPSSVTEIGDNAFRYQDKLKNVIFHDNTLTKIGNSAFEQTAIASIDLPKFKNGKIGDSAFRIVNLMSIAFPEGIVSIGSNIVNEHGRIRTIILPSTLKELNYSFPTNSSYDDLEHIYYPGSEKKFLNLKGNGSTKASYKEMKKDPHNWYTKMVFNAKTVSSVSCSESGFLRYYEDIDEEEGIDIGLIYNISPKNHIETASKVVSSNETVVTVELFGEELNGRQGVFLHLKKAVGTSEITFSAGAATSTIQVKIINKPKAEKPVIKGTGSDLKADDRITISSELPDAQIFYLIASDTLIHKNELENTIYWSSEYGRYVTNSYSVSEYLEPIPAGDFTDGTHWIHAVAVNRTHKISDERIQIFKVKEWGDAYDYREQFNYEITNVPAGVWVPNVDLAETGLYYNGKPHKLLNPKVFFGTTLLTEGKDYTLSYSNNTNACEVEDKQAYFKVNLKGAYSGTSDKFYFSIYQSSAPDPNDVSYTKVYAIAGKDKKPQLKLSDAGCALKAGTDYTLKYRPSDVSDTTPFVDEITEVGLYDVELTMSGNYRGSFRLKEAVELVKERKNIGKPTKLSSKNTVITINTPAEGFIYNGSSIDPEYKVEFKKSKTEKVELTLGKDFTVRYGKNGNTNAGKVTMTIIGKNNYTGTVTKTFTIRPVNLRESSVMIYNYYEGEWVEWDAESNPLFTYSYVKSGVKPKIKLSDGLEELVEGRDYKVKLSYNKKPGDRDAKVNKRKKTGPPTISVTGIGNYSNSFNDRTFTIEPVDFNQDDFTLKVSNVAGANKANKYSQKVTVVDSYGNTLKAGTDYEKTVKYYYANDTIVKQKVKKNSVVNFREAGTEINKKDIIPAGCVIRAQVTGKSAYSGILTGEYVVTAKNIKSLKFKIADQTFTGKAVTPGKTVIEVTNLEASIAPYCYEIVGYKNNIKKGTAQVTVRGTGAYAGTAVIKFKIR
ncbi:MAG: leucine-rich repeat domain-containing protein [Lachnospiraceae bacterium]|nr:leucine-rich repeat domain-containing protein [Lachnospiraceae bacterium]